MTSKLPFLNALMNDSFENLKHLIDSIYCLLNEFRDVVYFLSVFRTVNCF